MKQKKRTPHNRRCSFGETNFDFNFSQKGTPKVQWQREPNFISMYESGLMVHLCEEGHFPLVRLYSSEGACIPYIKRLDCSLYRKGLQLVKVLSRIIDIIPQE